MCVCFELCKIYMNTAYLILHLSLCTILHTKYLTPACCLTFLFFSYCSDMFRHQLLTHVVKNYELPEVGQKLRPNFSEN